MLTKAERFQDNRKDRVVDAYRHCAEWRACYLRENKEQAKAFAPLFKAVRQDKRWAAPTFFSTLTTKEWFFHRITGCQFTVRLERELSAAEAKFEYEGLPKGKWTAAHRATLDPTKIACYPTLADMRRGREVVMSAGKYFAAVCPDWDAAKVQAKAEAFIECGNPAVVHYAETADEWVSVYRNGHGFRSCMTDYADDEYHPVRFYVYPDNGLKLAYLQCGKSVVARCIVHTGKKQYVRVYGDSRLKAALAREGYVASGEALSGVKCAVTFKDGALVAPYLDGHCDRIQHDKGDDYCTIGDRGNWCADTGGVAESRDERPTCECCGDHRDEEEMTYSDRYGVMFCDSCANEYWTYAIVRNNRAEDYIRSSEAVSIDDTMYLSDPDLLQALGFRYYEDTGEWVTQERYDELTEIEEIVA